MIRRDLFKALLALPLARLFKKREPKTVRLVHIGHPPSKRNADAALLIQRAFAPPGSA